MSGCSDNAVPNQPTYYGVKALHRVPPLGTMVQLFQDLNCGHAKTNDGEG